MFFVNPFFKQIPQTIQQKQKKILQVHTILTINKKNRQNQDKKILYEYFYHHQYLKEIERSKSLRARILCINQIILLSQKQYIQSFNQHIQDQKTNNQENLQNYIQSQTIHKKYKILQRFVHDSSLAVIDLQNVKQIMQQNQDHIKTIMNQLKKYSFIKNFQYHQILYLSHFIRKIQPNTIKYKEFLFKENQPVQYVYFICQGEFQVYKNIQFDKENSLIKSKSKKEADIVKRYLQRQQSPYKIKNKKIIKQELSKIQGGSGQCFGEIQFFLNKTHRLYSLKCNSLTSNIFKINYKHLKQIFKYQPTKFTKYKKQYQQKHQTDLSKLLNSKYSKQGILNLQIKPINQINKSIQNLKSNNSKLSQIIYSMDRYKTLQSQGMERSFTLPNNTIEIPINQHSLRKNHNRQKNAKSQQKYSQRFQTGFSSQVRTSKNQLTQSVIIDQQPSLEIPFFPVISKNYLKKNSTIEVLLPSIAKRRNRVKGLMDIDTIIREKQDLIKAKKLNILNPQFSFYKIDQKNHKLLNFEKQTKKSPKNQQKSIAHSRIYMKNLVKQTLKRSGYIEQASPKKFNKNKLILDNIKKYKIQQIKKKTIQSPNHQIYNSIQLSKSIQITNSRLQSQRSKQRYSPYILSNQQRNGLSKNDFDQFFYKI